jgi:hypothetical protein
VFRVNYFYYHEGWEGGLTIGGFNRKNFFLGRAQIFPRQGINFFIGRGRLFVREDDCVLSRNFTTAKDQA